MYIIIIQPNTVGFYCQKNIVYLKDLKKKKKILWKSYGEFFSL